MTPSRKGTVATRVETQRDGTVLDRRALNRALLARQLLLRRVEMPVPHAIEHLVGLQAQAASPPYFALWSRLVAFEPALLARMLEDREVVRIALMRSTIHLVTARDCLRLRPLMDPVIERSLRGNYARSLGEIDREAVTAAGRALVEERPRTFLELGRLLAERWPGREPSALANAVRAWVPLVQVPPHGVWGRSGPAAHTSMESWLGSGMAGKSALDDVVVRYLAAFGPASVRDAQIWSGLTRLRDVLDRLRPRLRTFRDEHGTEVFDLPDAPRPDPATPVPPRFLPEYDNVLLSHADRTRIVADEHRRRIMHNGFGRGSVLVNGFVRCTWRIRRARGTATLVIEPLARLSRTDASTVQGEGVRLLAFAAADARKRDVRIEIPD